MNIEDLLYHLQHPETLNQLTIEEINQLLIKYPYLESLKLLYDKKINSHTTDFQRLDIHHRLELAAHQSWSNESDYTYSPPVFDLPVADSISIDETVVQEQFDSPAIPEPWITQEEPKTEKFQLYPYQESEFIQYLNQLSPIKTQAIVDTDNIPPSASEVLVTEKLISTSVDLQSNFGTESLADLWAVQGKHQQAIGIYEKLALEYPDKKTIFAAKIEKLKAEDSL